MEKFALIKSLGFSECEEDSRLAYELYDKWTHCELTLEEAIEFVLENGMDEFEADAVYDASLFGRLPNYRMLGRDNDNCILTYDSYVGGFNVYELVGDWD